MITSDSLMARVAYSSPAARPSSPTLEVLMDKDFYPVYFEIEGRHWWFVGRRRIFLHMLEAAIPRGDRPIDILDFGCGTGAFLEYLDRFGSFRAVDADASAVQ